MCSKVWVLDMPKTIEYFYDPVELHRWLACDRQGHGFPHRQHLKYCKFETGEISCERSQYFAEAWLCRHYFQRGCEVFHERFWLHDFSYQGRQTYSNDRIVEILGGELAILVENEAQKLRKKVGKFGNPDVIAYNPKSGELFMLEAKLWKPDGRKDKLAPHQIESIELLARLLPQATVAVAELKPRK
jgi:hypothetical protein